MPSIYSNVSGVHHMDVLYPFFRTRITQFPKLYDRVEARELWNYTTGLQAVVFSSIQWDMNDRHVVRTEMAAYSHTCGTMHAMAIKILAKMDKACVKEEQVEVYIDICKFNESMEQFIAPTPLELRCAVFGLIYYWATQLDKESARSHQTGIRHYNSFLQRLDKAIITSIDQRNTVPRHIVLKVDVSSNQIYVCMCLATRITKQWYARVHRASYTTDNDLYYMHLQIQTLIEAARPLTDSSG